MKTQLPAEIINRRRKAVLLRQDYGSLILRILLILVAGWIVFSQLFLLTQAKGSAMYPAVKDGDLVFAFRLQKKYQADDVVIYRRDGKQYIGRIAAMASDVVSLDDSGTLIVNGTVQGGDIIFPTYAGETLTYPYRVAGDSVFVLGDYRTRTEDSRDFGSIPLDDVEGKVITYLRRRGL